MKMLKNVAIIALVICGKSMNAVSDPVVPTTGTLNKIQENVKNKWTTIADIKHLKQAVIELDGFMDATTRLLNHARTVQMNAVNQLTALRKAEIAKTKEKLQGMEEEITSETAGKDLCETMPMAMER